MTEAPTAAQIAGKLTKAQREAVLALYGSEWKQWPEGRLAQMMDGLGKRGLRELGDAGIACRNGTQWVLTPLGLAVRAILMEQDRHG